MLTYEPRKGRTERVISRNEDDTISKLNLRVQEEKPQKKTSLELPRKMHNIIILKNNVEAQQTQPLRKIETIAYPLIANAKNYKRRLVWWVSSVDSELREKLRSL
jgi:hypothetical protein